MKEQIELNDRFSASAYRLLWFSEQPRYVGNKQEPLDQIERLNVNLPKVAEFWAL